MVHILYSVLMFEINMQTNKQMAVTVPPSPPPPNALTETFENNILLVCLMKFED